MLLYAVRRLLLAIPLLVAVSFLVFAVVSAFPGDPARIRCGTRPTTHVFCNVRHRSRRETMRMMTTPSMSMRRDGPILQDRTVPLLPVRSPSIMSYDTLSRSVVFVVTLAVLLVGHSLGDHVAQTDRQATHKATPGRAGWRAARLADAGFQRREEIRPVGIERRRRRREGPVVFLRRHELAVHEHAASGGIIGRPRVGLEHRRRFGLGKRDLIAPPVVDQEHPRLGRTARNGHRLL